MVIDLFPNGCPVCHNTKTEHHCYEGGHEYRQCTSCGLVYQVGQTDPEAMLACYTGGPVKRLRRRLLNNFRQIEKQHDFDLRMTRARGIFEFSAAKTGLDKGVYLDIGCNKGFNIYAAEEKGWVGFGNELIGEITIPIKNSKPHLRERIKVGSFLDLSITYRDEQFDLITCIDVIEHVTEPERAMQEMFRITRPGGVVIYQTPWVTDEYLAMKENWGALKANEHLLLFNKDNFKTMAERVGFTKIEFADEPFEVCDGNFVATCWK